MGVPSAWATAATIALFAATGLAGAALPDVAEGPAVAPVPVAEPAAPTPDFGPLGAVCAAPCGWINPLIDLDFPDKMKCGAGKPAHQLDRAECYTLLGPGESLVLEGTMRWYWDMSYEGTYVNEPMEDIVVSFAGTASNPDWLEFAIEPATFAISTVDLFTPSYWRIDDSNPSQAKIHYWYEKPVTLTVTRTGDPDAESLERAEARSGIVSLFVKAKSTESSERFKAAFGVEEIRFDAASEIPAPEAKSSPAPALAVLAVAALAAALVAKSIRRRR